MRLRTLRELAPAISARGIATMLSTVLVLLVLGALLQNIRLVLTTVTSDWTFSTKGAVLLGLVIGLSKTPETLVILVLSGILAGANITLRRKAASTCGILSAASAGCAACGTSLLGTLGFGAVATLPLQGLEIGILGIIILTATILFTRMPHVEKQ